MIPMGECFLCLLHCKMICRAPAMRSGARTQPQFSGHTYRVNRSTRRFHAKLRLTADAPGSCEQVDHFGIEIVGHARRDLAKAARAIGGARAEVGDIAEL